MRGWFDAFRHDGGPTLYDHANRTAVTGDVPTITLCVVFITLFVAFLIIFPGIRKQRFTTFTSVTMSLFIGAVILVGNMGSEWHVAEKQITSAYRAFSPEKIVGDLGVYIGFNHVNVSLRSGTFHNSTSKIDYNERFTWEGPSDMIEAYESALRKGLPYPILTVAEYLSLDEEGFCWGRIYRSAGYFSGICLWSAFASWILMNILLVTVPRYGGYGMVATGGLMLLTNLTYYLNIPSRPLIIRFEGSILSFSFGWCFWLVLIAGVLCTIAGSIIVIVDLIYPHKFSTILELDYDTPYDRHIIIEESHDTKRKKPRLEEPFTAGFGSKIFRRISKRGEHGGSLKFGIDNPSMELEPPKSPWRYPHRTFNTPMRTESRKSTKSVGFRDQTNRIYGRSLHPASAALANQLEAMNVESLPDVHAQDSESPKMMMKTSSDVSLQQSNWEPDPPSDSGSDAEDQEVERVQNVPTSAVLPMAVDFQSQFRTSLMGITRQNSQDSRRNVKTVDDEWQEAKGRDHRAHLSQSSSSSSRASASGSGSSTPQRRISREDDIQLDRSDSTYRRAGSGLATVSARISAAVDADRSSRRGSGDEAHVDMW